MNRMDRRTFIGAAAAAAASPLLARAKDAAEIRAVLLHLGHNMWCDWYPEGFDLEKARKGFPKSFPDTELRCRDDLWKESTDYVAAKGMNMLVIDIGEGLVFPSHPELAIRGSWTPDRLRAEITRLNALGLEVIPKLNFSTTHNGWLKQYRHQLYTPKYYQVCEDLIRDVCEIFNHPRLFHIGCDEESALHQDQSRRSSFILVRRGEFWWHDFFHLIATCEKNGTRPWAWPDFAWDNPEYYDRCPKSVLQCTWYYDEEHGGFDLATNRTGDLKRLMEFVELEKRGFDQTPCGTNWVGWVRKAHKVDADDVIGKLVRFARENIAPERLKGFMMASWAACDTRENVDFLKRGVDLFAATQRT